MGEEITNIGNWLNDAIKFFNHFSEVTGNATMRVLIGIRIEERRG